jgi:hypothetical protein
MFASVSCELALRGGVIRSGDVGEIESEDDPFQRPIVRATLKPRLLPREPGMTSSRSADRRPAGAVFQPPPRTTRLLQSTLRLHSVVVGRMKTQVVLVAVCCLVVAGCAVQRAMVAQDAQGKLVGLSKEQVLACMGPPANRMAEGATEVWSYASGDGRTTTVASTTAVTDVNGSDIAAATMSALGERRHRPDKRFGRV